MKQFIYFSLILFLVSCTGNTIYKEPENLIPRDSMVMLLTDMYVASSSRFEENKQSQKDINYMPLVYEKYKIDSLRFSESNIYYTSKIEKYSLLLKEVKSNLKKLNKIYSDSLKAKDSLITKEIKGKLELENIDDQKLPPEE